MNIPDVGAVRSARSILNSVDYRLSDPIGIVIRWWGIGLWLVVLIAHFGFHSLGGTDRSINLWLAVDGLFLLSLELIRRVGRIFYDSTWFRLTRILAYIVLITWLIAISPLARPLLVFLYIVPIFAGIVYLKEKRWLSATVSAATLIALYFGGIQFAVRPPLTLPQYGLLSLALIMISVLMWRLYEIAVVDSGVLAGTVRTLHQELDLGKLVTLIGEISQQITGASRILVIVVDPESDPGNRRYIDHFSRGYELKTSRSIEELAKKCSVIRSGEPFITQDAAKEFLDGSIYQEFFDILPRSILVQPITGRENKVLGVINVSHENSNYFNEVIRNQFAQFSVLVGSAVENCLLYRQALLDKAAHQDVSEQLTLAAQESEIEQILVGEAQKLFPRADGCVYHAYDPISRTLSPAAASHVAPTQLGKSLMQFGEGIAGRSLSIGESIMVPDLDKHPWYQRSSQENRFRSLMVAPLIDPISQDPIGTLSIHSMTMDAFRTSDEAEMVSLAHQGALSISRVRLFERWRERGGVIRRIFEAISRLDLLAGEENLCEQIVSAAPKILGFRIARIRLIDRKTEDLVTAAISGLPEEEAVTIIGQRIPYQKLAPYLREQYRAERSFLIPEDAEGWQELCNQYFYVPKYPSNKAVGWRAYDALITPLETQSGELLGILTLDLPEKDTQPTPEVIEAIGVFATAATMTLELARLRSHLVDQQGRTRDFVGSIGRELAATQDLGAICKTVVQVGANLLSAEGCSLYLISENKLQLKESNYLPTSYLGREKPVSTGPKSGLTAWVAASDEVIQSNHQEYKKYKAWAGESDHLQYLPSKKLNSLLIVPICLPGQAPVGVLKLENKTSSTGPGEFNREDVDNLLYLAQQLALALEVVKQYERIQKWERIGLEDDLHELVNWYHNGVVLFLEKLRIDLEEDDLESAKRLIGEIVHRAITTTVELKTIHTAVTRKYFEIEEFDRGLREMVDAWKNRESGRNYDLSIDVSCPTDIQLQPEVRNRLLRIASGAVSNAIRHSGIRYDPGIKIKVTVESFDHRLKMTVQDTGVGMVKIEPKFGIGRMMQLVDQLKTIGYDADIRLISEPGQGTTVTVYLGLEPSNQMVEAQRVMGAQFS